MPNSDVTCPYCTEAISEGAVICRYCRQNVGLALTLMTRLAELEKQLEAAEAAALLREASTVRAEIPLARMSTQAMPTRRHFVTLAILNICAYATFFTWLIFYENTLPKPLGIALIFFPFASGALFGAVYGGVFFKKQIVISVVTVAVTIGPFVARDLAKGLFRFPQDLAISVVALFVPGLLSASGSLTGRWIRSIRRGRVQEGAATRVAVRLLSARSNSSTRRKFVPALAAVFGAIAPILTFMASIIGAYLAYLAAIAGKR
jgi:hypothetical protein